MKAEGAKLNTHIISVNGFVTYDEKTLLMPMRTTVDIRCTSDSYGETLSLTVNNVQILVKVSDIERIIEETRKDRK